MERRFAGIRPLVRGGVHTYHPCRTCVGVEKAGAAHAWLHAGSARRRLFVPYDFEACPDIGDLPSFEFERSGVRRSFAIDAPP